MTLFGIDLKKNSEISAANYKIKKNITVGQENIDFGIGPIVTEKHTGIGQFTDENLGFLGRIEKIDKMLSLNRPQVKSFVEGFSTGLGENLDTSI